MNLSAQNDPHAWPPYEVRTHNQSSTSENRMHSDAVAQGYGDKLVPSLIEVQEKANGFQIVKR